MKEFAKEMWIEKHGSIERAAILVIRYQKFNAVILALLRLVWERLLLKPF